MTGGNLVLLLVGLVCVEDKLVSRAVHGKACLKGVVLIREAYTVYIKYLTAHRSTLCDGYPMKDVAPVGTWDHIDDDILGKGRIGTGAEMLELGA